MATQMVGPLFMEGGDSVLEVILEVEDGRVSGAGVRDAHTQQPPECGPDTEQVNFALAMMKWAYYNDPDSPLNQPPRTIVPGDN